MQKKSHIIILDLSFEFFETILQLVLIMVYWYSIAPGGHPLPAFQGSC